MLAWGGERSGYELHQLAGRTVGFIWKPARSQLYAVLKRLAADGLITGRHVEQADRPDKRIFSITDAGLATLRDWLDQVEPIEPEDRDGVLLKLFFGELGDPEAGRAQLPTTARASRSGSAPTGRSSARSTTSRHRRAAPAAQPAAGIALMEASLALGRRDARRAGAEHEAGDR